GQRLAGDGDRQRAALAHAAEELEHRLQRHRCAAAAQDLGGAGCARRLAGRLRLGMVHGGVLGVLLGVALRRALGVFLCLLLWVLLWVLFCVLFYLAIAALVVRALGVPVEVLLSGLLRVLLGVFLWGALGVLLRVPFGRPLAVPFGRRMRRTQR